MKTTLWGPSAWRFLHSVTFTYPEFPTEEHKKAASDLFLSLKQLMPCRECCDHYCQELLESPPRTESRRDLSTWLVELHNRVNVRLGKQIRSYESVEAEYVNEDDKCSYSCNGSTVETSNSDVVVSPNSILSISLAAVCIIAVIAILAFKMYKNRNQK